MANLKIQCNKFCPLVDFNEFMEQDNCGYPTQVFIDGAKGNGTAFKGASQIDYYECLWNMAMEFSDKYLQGKVNGITQSWYVEEFFKAIGVPIYRNGKIIG